MTASDPHKHALDTALLAPEDNLHAQGLARSYFYASVIVIMCSAVVFALVPNSWFESDILASSSKWAREIWPKLDHDATVLDARANLRGTKHIVFVIYCGFVMLTGSAIALPLIARSILMRASRRLTYPESGVWWKALLCVLVLVYFNVFETSLVGSSQRLGRSVTDSWFLWFWTALLWWALFIAAGTAIVFAIRLCRYGFPESKEDYLWRKNREEKQSAT